MISRQTRMPTYQYQCKACNHEFEELQSISEPPLVTCPNCRKDTLARIIGSGAGVIFKGSGFYLTDYKKGDLKEETKPKKEEKKPETSTPPPKTGSKPPKDNKE